MSIGAAEAEGSLSIRSYSLTQASHAHDHPQIVVPLTGSMTIGFGAQTYRAGSGHCVVIPAGLVHHYAASDEARFLVADMADLPENATALPEPCVAISADLSAFCAYAETQLTRAATPEIGALLYRLFQCLIARQAFASRMDDRIMRAVMRMEEDLGETHAIGDLAATACLSPSQFKALFRKNLGMSCSDFLTKRRMEQARTLLMNTDYPVSVVAMAVGYEDASAFSRRFRAHFGQRPREVSGGR